jgi:hypothetical protein
MTYNLPHTVLDVVRSNVVGRSSGTDYNHFLPSIVLRTNELGRMDNLSLETFLRLRRGCGLRALAPSGWSTHLSFKVGNVGFSRQPKGNDDVGGVKDSHCSIGSTTTDGNVPLPFLILPHLFDENGSPDVQLQRLGIEFQPISKLKDDIGHNPTIDKKETYLRGWCIHRPT